MHVAEVRDVIAATSKSAFEEDDAERLPRVRSSGTPSPVSPWSRLS